MISVCLVSFSGQPLISLETCSSILTKHKHVVVKDPMVLIRDLGGGGGREGWGSGVKRMGSAGRFSVRGINYRFNLPNFKISIICLNVPAGRERHFYS